MEGTIVSFRRGRHTQNTRQMLVMPEGVDSKDKAEKLVGRTVSWQTSGKEKKVLTGKISAPHGSKGVVRVLFETGMPGQSLGQKVKID